MLQLKLNYQFKINLNNLFLEEACLFLIFTKSINSNKFSRNKKCEQQET